MADTVFIKGSVDQADYVPTADVACGSVIIVGNVPMISNVPSFSFNAALPLRMIALARRGGFYLVAAAGAIPAGSRVWWDNVAKQITLVEAGNKLFGITGLVASVNPGDLIPCEHQPTASVGTLPSTAAALGSVQGDGVLLAAGLNVITGADGTKGARFPVATVNTPITVVNSSASILKLWPATGGGINALGANTVMSMPANTTATFYPAADGLTWWSSPRVPS